MPAPAVSRVVVAEGAPRGGIAVAAGLGSLTNMADVMATATGLAGLISVGVRLSRDSRVR